MTRNILPLRRAAENFAISRRAIITVGYYANGAIGEVFINAPKVGSELEATARDGAVLISLALQHGVPLQTMQRAVTRNGDGSPSTVIGAAIDKLTEITCEALPE